MPKIIEHNLSNGEKLISFWCPGCDGSMAVCPTRWNWNGDTEKPTLSPSILQKCGPFPDGHIEVCHCFVRDGNIELLGDCTHGKVGTFPLPDWNDVVDFNSVAADGGVSWARKQAVK